MKTAIISDLHLKENDKEFFKIKREELVINTINNICNDPEVTDVILLGDTFNEYKISASGYVVNFFKNHIAKPLIENDKMLHILIGNHERTTGGHTFNLISGVSHPNIKVYDKITTWHTDDFNGVFVPFLYPADFDEKVYQLAEPKAEAYIKDIVAKLKEKNPEKPVIIFNHNIMTDGLPFDNGRESNIKYMDFKNVDFVFGGHIHKHEVFYKGGTKEEKGMYVGSFMKSFVYEEESEGYVYFNIKNNQVNYEYKNSVSYTYEKLIIKDMDKFDRSVIKPGTVYDITVYADNHSDNPFFMSDLSKYITEQGSYVKEQKVITKEFDDNVTGISNIITSTTDILKDYLSENKIRDKETKNRYYDKLETCEKMSKVTHQAEIDKKVEKNVEKNIKKVNDLSSIIKRGRTLD